MIKSIICLLSDKHFLTITSISLCLFEWWICLEWWFILVLGSFGLCYMTLYFALCKTGPLCIKCSQFFLSKEIHKIIIFKLYSEKNSFNLFSLIVSDIFCAQESQSTSSELFHPLPAVGCLFHCCIDTFALSLSSITNSGCTMSLSGSQWHSLPCIVTCHSCSCC